MPYKNKKDRAINGNRITYWVEECEGVPIERDYDPD